jgi:hypothetical protein
MKKLSGWQKAGLVAGVGCFSILGMLGIGLVVAVVWARSTIGDLGDTTPATVERTIPVAPAVDTSTAPPAGTGAAASPDTATAPATPVLNEQPLNLTVDLQEGSFTIRPGPPGSPVQVQGTFAPGLYELTENHDTASRRATIRFRSKAPMWARILSGIAGGDDSGDRPKLTVLIPPTAPMNLTLRLSMGESRIDLGGLDLGDVTVDASMGEHRLDFGQPVTGSVRRLRLDTNMGNMSVDNLGNARPQTVETAASMGNLTADLGGAWMPGSAAALSFTQSMGELTLRVPSAVRLETDFRNAEGQPSDRPAAEPDASADPKAPLLRLRVTSSMGETRVVRY